MDSVREYHAHQGRVTATLHAREHSWVLSAGRDKYFSFHCVQTGKRLGGYLCNSWCTALQYDEESRLVFIGIELYSAINAWICNVLIVTISWRIFAEKINNVNIYFVIESVLTHFIPTAKRYFCVCLKVRNSIFNFKRPEHEFYVKFKF